jgi:hypothetical protein
VCGAGGDSGVCVGWREERGGRYTDVTMVEGGEGERRRENVWSFMTRKKTYQYFRSGSTSSNCVSVLHQGC